MKQAVYVDKSIIFFLNIKLDINWNLFRRVEVLANIVRIFLKKVTIAVYVTFLCIYMIAGIQGCCVVYTEGYIPKRQVKPIHLYCVIIKNPGF